MNEYFACRNMCMFGMQTGQRALNPMEVHAVVEGCWYHVGSADWTWVLWKKATSALNCLAVGTVPWHYNFYKHFHLYEEVVLSNDTTMKHLSVLQRYVPFLKRRQDQVETVLLRDYLFFFLFFFWAERLSLKTTFPTQSANLT